MKNYLFSRYKDAEFLVCTSVEKDTHGRIEDMANLVAEEIVNFIDVEKIEPTRMRYYISCLFYSLSFIGHSMGSVIIRYVLTTELLEPYLPKLYTFLSMSSPHLGTLYSVSNLIPSG
jgi:hypothetical protein